MPMPPINGMERREENDGGATWAWGKLELLLNEQVPVRGKASQGVMDGS
jgi:hypothetical protein